MRLLTVKPMIFFNTPRKTEFALHQAAGLTLQEAELIETFLARRLEIPLEVRRLNGQRIADMISARLNIPRESRPADNENFLEVDGERMPEPVPWDVGGGAGPTAAPI